MKCWSRPTRSLLSFINALASFRDPALIDRALLETRGRVRNQDTALYLTRFFENPAARDYVTKRPG